MTPQHETVTLLPCLFCGGDAKVLPNTYPWVVVCLDCGAEGPPSTNPTLASDRWNTRSPPPDQPETGDFPATSGPDLCCRRLSDGTRCAKDRETHSYCMEHAKELRANCQPETGLSDEEREALEAGATALEWDVSMSRHTANKSAHLHNAKLLRNLAARGKP